MRVERKVAGIIRATKGRWNMKCGDKVLVEEVIFNFGDEAIGFWIRIS